MLVAGLCCMVPEGREEVEEVKGKRLTHLSYKCNICNTIFAIFVCNVCNFVIRQTLHCVPPIRSRVRCAAESGGLNLLCHPPLCTGFKMSCLQRRSVKH